MWVSDDRQVLALQSHPEFSLPFLEDIIKYLLKNKILTDEFAKESLEDLEKNGKKDESHVMRPLLQNWLSM